MSKYEVAKNRESKLASSLNEKLREIWPNPNSPQLYARNCEVKIRCENGKLEIGENSRVRNHEILQVTTIKDFFYQEQLSIKKWVKITAKMAN